ncbi:Uncharacterized conserved protein GlcG, DUF336 family [Tistlia consotensis]|uniref:Uncharacterized conserved protein GlcG, DUF336 family n=1 Tax=Tistlia consotensis USBA 355 TaxID=560819 RepID=A0A1Y6B9U7_9PROT|nr:heme-binding protein [Tistlia consotensis]SME89175.1 Uncharacterized conserved protein GlcG, DUF336 family [Tistlia consotensis USBA 355]SNR25733.1 Uncharacterized conserved protein GlcG, DUF336 family [Tistlia consotensis]
MIRRLAAASLLAPTLAPTLALGLALSLSASLAPQARAEEEALVTFKVLAPQLAAELAMSTLATCTERGFQVAVAVVDRFGIPQAMLRARFAGPHTPDTATRKAWTAVTFRSDTLSLAAATQPGQPQSGARSITGVLMLGGGLPIEVSGQVVGAIGVSGAPSGEEDAGCAQAGLDSIQSKLPL